MSPTSQHAPVVTDVEALLGAQDGAAYREVLRGPAMSVGLFAPPLGHVSRQEPHDEDELYVVLSGTAVLEVDGHRTPVAAGSVAYVPRGVAHDFHDTSDDLRVVVVFAPVPAA